MHVLSASARLRRSHERSADPEASLARIRKAGDERDLFRKDRDKILYTDHLQRLSGVTQVLSPGANVGNERLHNRLTHTVKVAQIARRLAERTIAQQGSLTVDLGGVNADVAEAAAWAHDLGHPPLGHAGEKVLNDVMCHFPIGDGRSLDCGGFEGNAQSFRILTTLTPCQVGVDKRFVRGLNLTRATLAAVLKYPWVRNNQTSKFGVYETMPDIDVFNWVKAETSGCWRSPECEIMDFADDVAYSIFDALDFVRKGTISLARLKYEGAFDSFVGEQLSKSSPMSRFNNLFADADLRNLLRNVLFEITEEYTASTRGEADLRNYANYLIGLFTGDDVDARRALPSVDYSFRLCTPTEGTVAGVNTFRTAQVHPHVAAMISVLKSVVVDQIHRSDKEIALQDSSANILKPLLIWIEQQLMGALQGNNSYRWLWGWVDEFLFEIKPVGLFTDEQRKQICRLACDIVASLSEREAVTFYHSFAKPV